MKKFYEAPVVELTGFSAEDVITTSAVTPNTIDTLTMSEAEAGNVFTGYNALNKYDSTGSTTYSW